MWNHPIRMSNCHDDESWCCIALFAGQCWQHCDNRSQEDVLTPLSWRTCALIVVLTLEGAFQISTPVRRSLSASTSVSYDSPSVSFIVIHIIIPDLDFPVVSWFSASFCVMFFSIHKSCEFEQTCPMFCCCDVWPVFKKKKKKTFGCPGQWSHRHREWNTGVFLITVKCLSCIEKSPLADCGNPHSHNAWNTGVLLTTIKFTVTFFKLCLMMNSTGLPTHTLFNILKVTLIL